MCGDPEATIPMFRPLDNHEAHRTRLTISLNGSSDVGGRLSPKEKDK